MPSHIESESHIHLTSGKIPSWISTASFQNTVSIIVCGTPLMSWAVLLHKFIAVVQSLSCGQLFATPGTAASQDSLTFTISQSLLKFTSFESVMPQPSHLLLPPFSFCPPSFPASRSFPVSWLITLGGQSIWASASASVLPINVQDWFPLGWTGWISLQSKGLSRVFSSTTVQKHQFFSTWPSLWST